MKTRLVTPALLGIFVAAIIFSISNLAWAVPIAHLTLQSQPGDFIGLGGTFDITYTPSNSDLFFRS